MLLKEMKNKRRSTRFVTMDQEVQIQLVPPPKMVNYCKLILLVVAAAFIILTINSILIINLDRINKLQFCVPVLENGESPNPNHQCPIVNCPKAAPILPECPKFTPDEHYKLAWEGYLKSAPQNPTSTLPRSGSLPSYYPNPLTDLESGNTRILIGHIISLYSDSYFRGTIHLVNLKGEECVDLPVEFDDVTSSIKTYRTCVILCTHPGCGGRCAEMTDSTRGANLLGNIGFNDQISSLKRCHYPSY